MTKPLDELYLEWLYKQIADPGARTTYWKLARKLFTTEFVWVVPYDDNRVQDGQALRDEFLEDLGLVVEDRRWMDLGCSMLELLIGLSRRLSFYGDGEALDWFWQLMANVGLRIPDRKRLPEEYVDEVLATVIWRTYEPSGRGGLFPLENPRDDQRHVELWQQLNSYLMERE